MLWKDRLIMPQIRFPLSVVFLKFPNVDSRQCSGKISYQNNHAVDCKLVFRKFLKDSVEC